VFHNHLFHKQSKAVADHFQASIEQSMAAIEVSPVKKSPWGLPKKIAAVSIASIERETLTESDAQLAAKLHAEEHAVLVPQGAVVNVCGDMGVCGEDGEDACIEDDALLAARLQEEEMRAVGAVPPPAEVTTDEMIAMALQAEFDRENDREVDAAEKRANLFTNRFGILFFRLTVSKVSISFDRHRSARAYGRSEDVEVEEYDDDGAEPSTVYDRGTRTHRERGTGRIITKHDPDVCGTRNRHKMDHFPLSFARLALVDIALC
jgi:hypothetical protein